MPRVLHLIDHPGLGGAQRLVNTILGCRQEDKVIALRSKPPHLINARAEQSLYKTRQTGAHNLCAHTFNSRTDTEKQNRDCALPSLGELDCWSFSFADHLKESRAPLFIPCP